MVSTGGWRRQYQQDCVGVSVKMMALLEMRAPSQGMLDSRDINALIEKIRYEREASGTQSGPWQKGYRKIPLPSTQWGQQLKVH